jgi:hypothetical protein
MNPIPARIRIPIARTTGMWMARNQDPENRRVLALQRPKGRLIRKTNPTTTQTLTLRPLVPS